MLTAVLAWAGLAIARVNPRLPEATAAAVKKRQSAGCMTDAAFLETLAMIVADVSVCWRATTNQVVTITAAMVKAFSISLLSSIFFGCGSGLRGGELSDLRAVGLRRRCRSRPG
jgi:hypothetical protein